LSKIKKSHPISVFIGPEGGWSEKEIRNARENSFFIADLGRRTLRGETAATIASYLFSNF
jgi:16S rRNA (uracil1498-N3)-methyltransferase